MYIFTVALLKSHANAALNAAWGEGCRWGWHHLGIGEEKSVSFAWRTWSNAAPFKDVMHDYMTTRQAFGKKPPGFRCSHLNVHMLGYFVSSCLLLFRGRWKNIGDFHCALLFAGWTGLPIKVVFLLWRCSSAVQQKGGAVPSASPQKACLLQISVQKWSKKKQGGMWATRDPNRRSQTSPPPLISLSCCCCLIYTPLNITTAWLTH